MLSSLPISEEDGGGRPKLLVVDDDEQILKQIQWALSEEYEVFTATDRQSAQALVQREGIPVILLDLGLPPSPREATEGLLALEEILLENPQSKVIIVSGNSERQNALLALENGAHDIFPKPVEIEELKVVLRRAYRLLGLECESLARRSRSMQGPLEQIIGSSDAMRAILASIPKVAVADVPVLITGESGTGKELLARAVHQLSPRKDGPFVAINCAAIPENLLESELFGHEKGAFTGASARRRGRFEYAERGTLFLDEIGELAPALQVKLLRFLQERIIERVGGRESILVDARVMAATNQDLEKAAEANRFRQDLYFRLAVVKLPLPPLRGRSDDAVEIAERLVGAFSGELGQPARKLSQQAVEAIRQHDWPGNVRELQNRLKRAVLLAEGPLIGREALELEGVSKRKPPPSSSLKEAKQELEREMVARAMEENEGNISRAARALGVSRPTLYELIARYEL